MLPLWTRVTDLRPLARAYLIAARTRRFEPVIEIGLRPIPESGRTSHPYSDFTNSMRLGSILRVGLQLLPGVHVFGVLPEDDHVDLTRVLDG